MMLEDESRVLWCASPSEIARGKIANVSRSICVFLTC